MQQLLIKFAKDFKPKLWIKKGDMLDFAGYSDKDPRKQEEAICNIEDDIEAGIELLDSYDEILPEECEKVYMEGNHEYREQLYFMAYPKLRRKRSSYDRLLQLKERGYKFYPYLHQKPFKVGDLHFAHGFRGGPNAVKNHLEKDYHVSIAIGHLHAHYRAHSRTIKGKLIECISIPAMCQRNWKYSLTQNSQQGFAVFYILPNGKYQYYPIIVENYTFVFEGQVYSLNEQRRAA
jgi:hypothetical protein